MISRGQNYGVESTKFVHARFQVVSFVFSYREYMEFDLLLQLCESENTVKNLLYKQFTNQTTSIGI